eukprot:8255709-Pyramimonas_sp.AAC.1
MPTACERESNEEEEEEEGEGNEEETKEEEEGGGGGGGADGPAVWFLTHVFCLLPPRLVPPPGPAG